MKTKSSRVVRPMTAKERKSPLIGPRSRDELTLVENVADTGTVVEFVFPDFTYLCARSLEPDFGTISVRYIPGQTLVEVRSLQQYYWGFRTTKVFAEEIIGIVCRDLSRALQPRWLQVRLVHHIRTKMQERLVSEYVSPTGLTDGERSLALRYAFSLDGMP